MDRKPFKIGPLNLEPGLVLAPMSGVTNSSFRRLIKSENPNAVGLMVTEFISIEGLTRENRRSIEMMEFREEERPLSIQIFGNPIDRMVDSAKMVEATGADIVDINCGCPVPKVVKRGGGCELMRRPEHLANILTAVKKAVSIPLTLKIRSGWDENSLNAMEIAKMAEDCGVDMLAVHGRTRKSLYRGEADWSIVGEIASELNIPVVGSGDVINLETATKAFASGVAALMIGRGALTNPWIFSEIHAAMINEEYETPSDLETIRILEKYMEMLLEDLPEKAVIGKMKQFGSQVTRRVKGSTPVRRAICSSKTLAEMQEHFDSWREFLYQREARFPGDSQDTVLSQVAA